MKAGLVAELEVIQIPQIPCEIQAGINTPNQVTLTDFSNKNAILRDSKLQNEAGFSRFPDGSYVLSYAWYHPGNDSMVVLVASSGQGTLSGLVSRGALRHFL